MRLRDEKITYLAEKIAKCVLDAEDVQALQDESGIRADVERTMTEDLRLEDAIDEEVRQVLRRHARQIREKNMDYRYLFNKVKDQLLRERGITF